MDPGIATISASIVAAIAAVVTAFIAKYDLHLLFQASPLNLSGSWKGRSAYLAGRLFDPSTESLWKVDTDITQRGRSIKMSVTLTDFYDLKGKKLNGIAPRQFSGTGKLKGDQDVVVTFKQTNGLEHGVMYLVADLRGMELEGILVVRNPTLAGPVAVKFLLCREGHRTVGFDDLDTAHITNAVLEKHNTNALAAKPKATT